MPTDRCGNSSGQECSAKKKTEKKLKQNNLFIQIIRMWNMICVIILAMLWATAIVTKVFKKPLEAIPGKHSYGYLERR